MCNWVITNFISVFYLGKEKGEICVLCKSKQSSIALIVLFFFVFSIACCLLVGMAEDPSLAGEGGNASWPPSVDITPKQVNTDAALSFEFSLQGINLNFAPYAYVGIPPEQGIPAVVLNEVKLENLGDNNYRANFSSGLSEPGTYMLTILDGPSGGIIRWVAQGIFQIVQPQEEPDQLLQITLTPDQIPAGGEVAFSFDLSGVTLQNSPYAAVTIPPAEPGGQPTPVLLAVSVNQSEVGCQVSFSETITELGNYRLIIFDGQPTDPNNLPPVVAVGPFQVVDAVFQYPWFQVNPQNVPAYFRESLVIELCENQHEIWNATDSLEVRLFNYYKSPERVLEAIISDNVLIKTDDTIKFNLPASVDCGKHDVELFRGNNMIGGGHLYVNAPRCGVQPHPLFIDTQNKTVSLDKNDPETWHADEAGKLKLDIYQKNYYGPEPWDYNLEYKQTIESANLTVNEDTISLVFPELLNKGRYELILQRKINTEFWRTVGSGDLLYTDLFNLPISSDAFSGDPPAVRVGYELPINITLTDTGETVWSAGEPLNLNLFYFHPIDKSWNLLPANMQPYDVVVEDDSISAKLPVGMWAGDYTVSVSHANTVPPDEFALAQFRVLPLLELEAVNLPPAQVNQPYFGTVKVTGGTAPYYWNIHLLSRGPLQPEFQWPEGLDYDPDENDSSQLIITGTFTEPGVYPLEILVRDDDGKVSLHPIQLVVREGLPRVIAANAAGLPGRQVIVPIMGENLMGTGVSGIQFTLDYDPAVATIATEGVLPGTIPDAIIEQNIDNANGHALITITWTQPLPEQINFAQFCQIKFQINSNPANAMSWIDLRDVDGTLLTHGEYDIPAEVINGNIRAASYGDVNGNGKVEVGDAVLILRHSAGVINLPTALIELANVDASTDEVVGPADTILVLKRVVHLIDKFPIEP